MNDFLFDLDQQVMMRMTSEQGVVKGRAEYTNEQNKYWVLYKAADGRQVTGWWDESDLVHCDS